MKVIAENSDDKIALLERLKVALSQADELGEATVAIHINNAIEALKAKLEGG